jgi:hypothetical protein
VPPEVPPAGLEHTVGLVAELTPPVGFIELATGRSEVEVCPVLRGRAMVVFRRIECGALQPRTYPLAPGSVLLAWLKSSTRRAGA